MIFIKALASAIRMSPLSQDRLILLESFFPIQAPTGIKKSESKNEKIMKYVKFTGTTPTLKPTPMESIDRISASVIASMGDRFLSLLISAWRESVITDRISLNPNILNLISPFFAFLSNNILISSLKNFINPTVKSSEKEIIFAVDCEIIPPKREPKNMEKLSITMLRKDITNADENGILILLVP